MFAAHSQRHVELGAGNAGSAGPHDDNLHILQLAAVNSAAFSRAAPEITAVPCWSS